MRSHRNAPVPGGGGTRPSKHTSISQQRLWARDYGQQIGPVSIWRGPFSPGPGPRTQSPGGGWPTLVAAGNGASASPSPSRAPSRGHGLCAAGPSRPAWLALSPTPPSSAAAPCPAPARAPARAPAAGAPALGPAPAPARAPAAGSPAPARAPGPKAKHMYWVVPGTKATGIDLK